MLPVGTLPTPWWRHPGSGENILPIKVHHGECEIIFHTSGPDSQVHDPTWIVPNTIRDMARWVLAKCVFSRKGGMVTKDLANSIDYATNTSVDFWETPFPASMSFYSLHIWNYASDASVDMDPDWNPGDGDPDVANKIADALKLASLAASGAKQEELDARLDYIQETEMSMDRNDAGRVWWKLGPRLAQPGRNGSSIRGPGRIGSSGNLTVADKRVSGKRPMAKKARGGAKLYK